MVHPDVRTVADALSTQAVATVIGLVTQIEPSLRLYDAILDLQDLVTVAEGGVPKRRARPRGVGYSTDPQHEGTMHHG